MFSLQETASSAAPSTRYWVIGGDYRDCSFAQLIPGTETIHGPFGDLSRARTQWQRLTYRDRCSATTRYSIAAEERGRR